MTIVPTLVIVFKREKRWILSLSLFVVCLFLFPPLESKEMASGSAYLAGLVRRLTNAHFLLKAIASGLAVALISFLILLLVRQFGKWAESPTSADEISKE